MLKKAGLMQCSPPFSEMFTHLQFPCPWMPEHHVMAGGFPVLTGQGDGLGGSHPTSLLAPGLRDIRDIHCPVCHGSSLSAPESSPTPPLPQLGSRRKALLLLTLGLALKGPGAVSQPGCKPCWHVPTGSPKGGLSLPAPSSQGPHWDPEQRWGCCPFSSREEVGRKEAEGLC